MPVHTAMISGRFVFKLLVSLILIIPVTHIKQLPADTHAHYPDAAWPIVINTQNTDGTTNQRFLKPVLNKGVLLVAGKNLADPNFERTVVLITEFTKEGTAGLVINRRTKIPVAHALPQILKILPILDHLYIGGPVIPTGINLLIVSDKEIPGANNVVDNIYLISTLELFNKIIREDTDAKSVRLFSGYAGWAPGQLEKELMRGDWHLWHASKDIIFSDSPDTIWNELIQIVTARWVMNHFLRYY